MDLHKPKPWGGWREFAKELGTIVVGVLIALGAEQAVEALHRQAEVRETREALRDEIALNLRNVSYSLAEDRCVAKHFEAWGAWARGGPKPAFTAGIFPPLSFAAWDVAKSGPLAHMPLKERLADTRFYNALTALGQLKDRTGGPMTAFTGYHAYDRLTSAQADQVTLIVQEVITLMGYRRAQELQVLAEGKATGVTAAPSDPAMQKNLEAICREVGLGAGE